ncbi:MAG: cytochrome c3 family protein [Planctomycetes bacterium]|nr:cytochrome c3 family protein [Planctomycetota bacterium]
MSTSNRKETVLRALLRYGLPLVIVLVAGVAAASWLGGGGSEGVVQPIAFNHQMHIKGKEEMACKDCHRMVEKGPHATLPSVNQCMLCHEEAKGKHADEPKIRQYAEKKEEIPWVQVNHVVGHVYFSHAAHVSWAKIDCSECHGDMKNRTEPVTHPQVDHLNMDRCVACHEERGASNDCLTCHK